ncbi:MAG: FAD:protein FMN transferase [Candidatus Omnitrophica bacterium]|nr:FAD:protein FMN transferase [Candidatus Omnitrophota bacterium]
MNRLRPFMLGVMIVLFLCGCGQEHLYRSRQTVMGYYVEVVSPDKRAGKIVFSEIKRAGGLLSSSGLNSEILRLNRQGWYKASPEILYVIKKAGQFWKESWRAFDITTGPLADLWGFGGKSYRVPSSEETRAALTKIGFDKVQISDNIIKFSAAGVRLDLGNFARGYAIDSAVDKLKKAGIKSALISVDGDIYCLGDKKGKPWKVAIQDPAGKKVIGCLYLRSKAVSTYGVSGQYFVYQGARYGNIFNPRTGKPAYSGINSVTVIASDSMTADALAVSAYILGKDKGRELARKFNAQILIN